jgi:O-antigen ligase
MPGTTLVREAPLPVWTRPTPAPPIQHKRVYHDDTAATSFGFPVALIYLFALFSLGTEFSLALLGVKPYLTWICGPLGMIAAIASGNLFRTWKPGPGRWLILFTLWMLLALPLSYYKTGSLDVMTEYTTRQLPALFLLAALVTSLRQVEWFCRMMAFAGLFLLVMCVKFGGYSDNRFMIPGTSLENPNDFATHLLIAMPFCLLLVLNSGGFLKILGIAGVGGLTLTILRSGSRGALIALLAVIALLFWRLSGAQRASLVAICVVGGGLAVAIFPQVLWERFKTVFSSDPTPQNNAETASDSRTLELAESSSNARWYILKRSLEFTVKNPVFGLGPGNFAVAEAGLAKEQGKRGFWLGTHNSYTQASSEGGIPAFLFFTATVVSAIRANLRIHGLTRKHREFRSIANTALCLTLTLFGFAVNILFSHLAYRYYLPMLAGLTVAFSTLAEREIQAVLTPNRNGNRS